MSMIETIGSITTPFGNLVCEQWDCPDCPCFDLVLKRNDGMEILLAVVEHDTEDNCINVRTYTDLEDEEPTHNDTITAEDIERYTEEREL